MAHASDAVVQTNQIAQPAKVLRSSQREVHVLALRLLTCTSTIQTVSATAAILPVTPVTEYTTPTVSRALVDTLRLVTVVAALVRLTSILLSLLAQIAITLVTHAQDQTQITASAVNLMEFTMEYPKSVFATQIGTWQPTELARAVIILASSVTELEIKNVHNVMPTQPYNLTRAAFVMVDTIWTEMEIAKPATSRVAPVTQILPHPAPAAKPLSLAFSQEDVSAQLQTRLHL